MSPGHGHCGGPGHTAPSRPGEVPRGGRGTAAATALGHGGKTSSRRLPFLVSPFLQVNAQWGKRHLTRHLYAGPGPPRRTLDQRPIVHALVRHPQSSAHGLGHSGEVTPGPGR